MAKEKLLLNICCVGCGVYVARKLQETYDTSLYFYNPNIFPHEEYDRRLAEAKKIAHDMTMNIIIGEYEHDVWREKVRGFELEPEGGLRCPICFRMRLTKTAAVAKENDFDIFASTLTISPHKDAKVINEIGLNLEKIYGVRYLVSDFKKQGGFTESCRLSKELKLYRQNYCGCEFSLRDMTLRQKIK